MESVYKLVGLSKPRSATLEFFDHPYETFNAKYEDNNQALWNYCLGNWNTVNLKAIVKHEGINGYTPINPVVIRVEPI